MKPKFKKIQAGGFKIIYDFPKLLSSPKRRSWNDFQNKQKKLHKTDLENRRSIGSFLFKT